MAADAFNPESQWMLGDWNGQRTDCKTRVMTLVLVTPVKWVALLDAEKYI